MTERLLHAINNLEWDVTSDKINQKLDYSIKFFEEKVQNIISNPAKTFDTVINNFENFSGTVFNGLQMYLFQSSISMDADIRKTSSDADKKLSNYYIELGYNKDLYQAIKTVKELDEDLNDVQQRLLDDYLKDFQRNGLHLSEEKQEHLKVLGKEISDIAIAYRQEINESTEKFTLSQDQLTGVPENTIKNYTKNDDGTFSVGLSYPEVFPIFDFCAVSETRKFMTEQFSNIAIEKNTARIEKLIALRHEKAELLGFKSHSDFSLDIKLAKNPKRVFEFLDDLVEKLQPSGKKILEELVKIKSETEPDAPPKILAHDYRFYRRLYNEQHFQIDLNQVKQYFSLEYVLNGMLEFYQEMFSLSFTQLREISTWHKDVTVWEVKDEETDEFLGRFYLDLFPRDGKYGHAAAFTLIKAMNLSETTYQAAASAMVCNFNKPTADEPSLLNHGEVITLFHEFGHIIHQVITKEGYFRYSGTSVKRDFVEAPSQMLENWTWEPTVMKRISKHVETGESLPESLLMKLREARDKFGPLDYLRQIFFALYDLTAYSQSTFDTKSKWLEMQEKVSLVPAAENTNRAASFGQMASGYDSGYYGYLWSEVYAQDLYSRFVAEGVTSPQVGKAYRKWILEPGGAIDEDILVENYLGRKMNSNAFLKNIGLL